MGFKRWSVIFTVVVCMTVLQLLINLHLLSHDNTSFMTASLIAAACAIPLLGIGSF